MWAWRVAASAGLCAGLTWMGGCEVDSFIDPSVVGRWEHTPTVVPILDRISIIEADATDYVAVSEATSDDLIPEISEYKLGPGDALEIRIRDYNGVGIEEGIQRIVDERGYVDIPKIAPVNVAGLTQEQAKGAIADGIRAAQLLRDPRVSVVTINRRSQTYSVLGGVRAAGSYFIPEANFRLLEALTSAGGFDEAATQIFVIRQVPLSDMVTGGRVPALPPAVPSEVEPSGSTPVEPERLIDLIDDIAGEKKNNGGSPGVVAGRVQPGSGGGAASSGQPEPAIDLVGRERRAEQPRGNNGGSRGTTAGENNWVFLNGTWMKVQRQGAARGASGGLPEGPDPLSGRGEDAALVTQRVISVPTAPLLAGSAKHNIVIRPGDIIRVPVAEGGLVYLEGSISRPGTYNLPASGRLTLTRAIASAGGLGPVAIPERVDLTRMVGDNHQATIRLNLRAIHEGTQPDIFLRKDDKINIGTNFWALPLAVVRGGFRASYGFGFLLDRNWGSDVFGAPPTNNQ